MFFKDGYYRPQTFVCKPVLEHKSQVWSYVVWFHILNWWNHTNSICTQLFIHHLFTSICDWWSRQEVPPQSSSQDSCVWTSLKSLTAGEHHRIWKWSVSTSLTGAEKRWVRQHEPRAWNIQIYRETEITLKEPEHVLQWDNYKTIKISQSSCWGSRCVFLE